MQRCNLFVSIPFVSCGVEWETAPVYGATPPAVKRSYLKAVLAEMRGFAEDAPSLEVASVTFGTGSMSAIPEADLREFLNEIRRVFPIAHTAPVYATFDPGLLSIGQANELRAFGAPRFEFRYLTSNFDEATTLGVPSGETELKKTSILLEQTGLEGIVVRIAVGVSGQTIATLEKTLRDALCSTVEGFELLSLREGCAAAQSDDDAALLLEHARTWLEAHGFRPTTPTRFMRESADDAYHANLYTPIDGNGGPMTLSFGPSTVSAYDGLLWTNAGDINRYIRESTDPEAITERVISLNGIIAEQRRMFDALYRGESVAIENERFETLAEEGFLVECNACEGRMTASSKGDRRYRTASLSGKGRLRYQRVFERLAESNL